MPDTHRILIAPAPFKECLASDEVCEIIENGLRQVLRNIEIEKAPVCDGGTGIMERLHSAKGGQIHKVKVSHPFVNGEQREAELAILSDGTAVIESAKVIGLALIPRLERNPSRTSTLPVGEMLLAAQSLGATSAIVGCGDSSTNDGGMGIGCALGVSFLDDGGNSLLPVGSNLDRVRQIVRSSKSGLLDSFGVIVACNLSSVLCGQDGTSVRYAGQKGATAQGVTQLASGMENYGLLLADYAGFDIRYMPGSGAAGGLGAGLYAFANAEIRFSYNVVTSYLGLEASISKADVVITGEGMMDASSTTGKIPCAIALIAKKHDKLTAAVVGAIGTGAEIAYFHGIDIIEPCIVRPCALEDAIDPSAAKQNLLDAAIRLARNLKSRGLT